MKQINRILNKIFNNGKSLLVAGCVLSAIGGSAFAATNGCEDFDKNPRINPIITLCSPHAYNIGATQNPETQAELAAMNDVVALKSTIVTQQMKKQYDYLEVTIRRFKTQLEKAILVAEMEASGAASESGTSGGTAAKSNDKNVILAGTENCNNKNTTAEVFTCLRSNYNLIYNMTNGGQTLSTEARKQLANDYSVMKANMPTALKKDLSPVSLNGKTIQVDCSNFQVLGGRDQLSACLNALNTDIRRGAEEITRANSRTNAMGMAGAGYNY
ncbi:hypothetical protein LJC18_01980 [Lachnospiraceae bacterium OttesenSCG-928-E19]|nr:hypothetical protein [Lachnospiraceae bacterium OttesenSCG-928-E19]